MRTLCVNNGDTVREMRLCIISHMMASRCHLHCHLMIAAMVAYEFAKVSLNLSICRSIILDQIGLILRGRLICGVTDLIIYSTCFREIREIVYIVNVTARL